eukprot:scaffold916_cov92-Isochrysis_galbana.AAC.5
MAGRGCVGAGGDGRSARAHGAVHAGHFHLGVGQVIGVDGRVVGRAAQVRSRRRLVGPAQVARREQPALEENVGRVDGWLRPSQEADGQVGVPSQGQLLGPPRPELGVTVESPGDGQRLPASAQQPRGAPHAVCTVGGHLHQRLLPERRGEAKQLRGGPRRLGQRDERAIGGGLVPGQQPLKPAVHRLPRIDRVHLDREVVGQRVVGQRFPRGLSHTGATRTDEQDERRLLPVGHEGRHATRAGASHVDSQVLAAGAEGRAGRDGWLQVQGCQRGRGLELMQLEALVGRPAGGAAVDGAATAQLRGRAEEGGKGGVVDGLHLRHIEPARGVACGDRSRVRGWVGRGRRAEVELAVRAGSASLPPFQPCAPCSQ